MPAAGAGRGDARGCGFSPRCVTASHDIRGGRDPLGAELRPSGILAAVDGGLGAAGADAVLLPGGAAAAGLGVRAGGGGGGGGAGVDGDGDAGGAGGGGGGAG